MTENLLTEPNENIKVVGPLPDIKVTLKDVSKDYPKMYNQPNNPFAPHQSVINLTIIADIMERLEDGKVTGRPKKKIRKDKLFTIRASSYDECVTLTEQFLENFMKEREHGKNK